jgi:hypothetical protein
MALSQIMCNAPESVNPETVPDAPQEHLQLPFLNGEVFDLAIADMNQTSNAQCPKDLEVLKGPLVSFESGESGLFVKTSTGREYYAHRGSGRYCHLETLGDPYQEIWSCIENVSKTGYDYSVQVTPIEGSDNDGSFIDCFNAKHVLNQTLEQMAEEFIDDLFGDESNESSTESQEADAHPESPEFDIAQCVASPEHYVYETVNIRERSNDVIRKCNADGLLTNPGPHDLDVTAYRVHNYGGHNYEKWVYRQSLKPGDSTELTQFYRCTGGECGMGEWYYFTEIAVNISSSECSVHLRQFEEPPAEIRMAVPNPCYWD